MFSQFRRAAGASFGVTLAAYAAGVLLAGTVAALGSYRVIGAIPATVTAPAPPAVGPTRSAVSPRPPLPDPASASAQDKTLAGARRSPGPSLHRTQFSGSFSHSYRRNGDDYDDGEDERPRSYRPYRTMCVRLCDGYYFPVSFSVPRSRFAQDARTCERSCPGQARLFVYANPGGDIESMVDLQGRPYRQLPTAFLYRTQYVASCGCKPDPWSVEARERHRMYALEAASRKGSKLAAAELEALRAKMTRDGTAGPAEVAGGTNEFAETPRDPRARTAERSSRADQDDDSGRMGLGAGADRQQRARSPGTWRRNPEWMTRALGRDF
jgi:hypothetical protein